MRKKAGEMEWDDLRFVLALARATSLTAAARALNVDHATVSRRAQRLEQSFNTKLFDRTRTGFVPTAAGQKVIELAEMVESALRRTESEITDRNIHLVGTVRVGSPDGIGSMFLAPRLGALCQIHPELEVQLITSPLRFSLARREADIVLTLEKPEHGRVAARKVTDYTLHLYAHRRLIADRGMPAVLSDLKSYPVIGYIPGYTFSPRLDFLPEVADGLKPNFTTTHILSQVQAVRAGTGIAILPDFIVADDPDIVPVLPEQFGLEKTFYMVVHEDSRRLARIEAVADFIHDEIRKARTAFRR